LNFENVITFSHKKLIEIVAFNGLVRDKSLLKKLSSLKLNGEEGRQNGITDFLPQ
jgi:hypothetical protein